MTILAALLTSLGFPLSPESTAAAEGSNIAPTDLARGRWARLFVVVPPAVRLTKTRSVGSSRPMVLTLKSIPSSSDHGERGSGRPRRPRPGCDLRRAPTVVFLLNGCPLVRLDWPFTGDNRGVEELATAPREGPQQHLGAALSWGVARTLVNPPDGRPSRVVPDGAEGRADAGELVRRIALRATPRT